MTESSEIPGKGILHILGEKVDAQLSSAALDITRSDDFIEIRSSKEKGVVTINTKRSDGKKAAVFINGKRVK
ncbi:hypothetical protein [Bacterioplanoides sp. SCSIO 12839]|uniref:hypothetical protein n=1 Tax=Bacterioplanoides sp. SCSIO 12839 TaxID=2829569 RepID=UPI002105D33D|nr:hypothetical protein [Bacterioplanoides sp. SCSIO 12839]UTW47085.1 hypothetical protein KFF03_10845 [Bacterioplanoides sp. SCSIO 12839]